MSPRHPSTKYIIIGLVFLILNLFAPLRRFTHVLQTRSIEVVDFALAFPRVQFTQLQLALGLSHARIESVLALEQENRRLYAQLSTYTKSTHSAQLRLIPGTIATQISFASGEWIILAGKQQLVSDGDIIVQDGVMVGTIQTAFDQYSTINLVGLMTQPLLILHPESKTAGVLRVVGTQLEVQFSKKVETLKADDILTLVPDGKHSKSAYPVVVVSAIGSTPTDSVTTARVRPIASIAIGDEVLVVHTP